MAKVKGKSFGSRYSPAEAEKFQAALEELEGLGTTVVVAHQQEATLRIYSTGGAVTADELVSEGLKSFTLAGPSVVASVDQLKLFKTDVDASERVAYQGLIPLAHIRSNGALKRTNWKTKKAVKRLIGVTGFVAPLVLDSDLRVIDGDLRLEVVQELLAEGHWDGDEVPAVVLNVTPVEAAFLRIVLNRTSEFQRWQYRELDTFLDATPELRPLLEPLGLYTESILPASAFAATALVLEEDVEKPIYDPETMTLGEWAAITGEAHTAKVAQKHATPLKPAGQEYASVYNLSYSDADLLPVHDVEAAVREHTLSMRDVANTITTAYDKKRRAEKEAKGQAWQTVRRSPKTVIADARAAAAAAQLDALLDEPVELTAEEEAAELQ
jgi:hypothetical protein